MMIVAALVHISSEPLDGQLQAVQALQRLSLARELALGCKSAARPGGETASAIWQSSPLMSSLSVELHDFRIGSIRVRPAARLLQSRVGSCAVEPLVMQLLIELSRNAGRLVTRDEIFKRCWGSAAVGDDSLNRVVAALRKALTQTDEDAVQVITVPGAGYVLHVKASDARSAIVEAVQSLRLAWPEPDRLRMEMLRSTCAAEPANPEIWGMLALLCRHAAEYSEPRETLLFLTEAEESARQALQLDPNQAEALVAIATVAPLFGQWLPRRGQLVQILGHRPGHFFAAHELAILEMATGRVRAAKALIDGLLDMDQLAACLCYKSIYQRWSVGDLINLSLFGDLAIQLWPTHPAVWTARFWTLAYTGCTEAAVAMVDDDAARPDMPAPALQLFSTIATALASDVCSDKDHAASMAVQAAARGPAGANVALLALGLFDKVDEAFAVAEAYYLREGHSPIALRRTETELSINDQHRRVTQVLFTPACSAMRGDGRFTALCERIGLADYWTRSGIDPDFRAA